MEDVLKLYGYWRSTASWRVRLALGIKGVAFETTPIHLARGEQLDPSFKQLNPQGFLPALMLDDGTVLTQSLAILEWLEETYPEPRLLPVDPILRARVRAFADVIACDVHPVQNLKVLKMLRRLGQDQSGVDTWAATIIEDGLAACAAMIDDQVGPYCFGEQVTMADVLLVPQLANARRFGAKLIWSRILAIEAACATLPAFQAAAPEAQVDFEAS